MKHLKLAEYISARSHTVRQPKPFHVDERIVDPRPVAPRSLNMSAHKIGRR